MKSIEQLWQEINQWARDNGARQHLQDLKGGASEEELAALEAQLGLKLPDDLRESLALHNGGGYFESYAYLGTERILHQWQLRNRQADEGIFADWDFEDSEGVLQDAFWDRGWIPFAEDSVGNLICVDMNPGENGSKGQLVYFEIQDRQGPYAAPDKSFHHLLSDFLDKLYNRKLAVDDEGFIDEPQLKYGLGPVGKHPPKMPHPYASNVLDLVKAGRLRPLLAYLKEHEIDVHQTVFDHSLATWAAMEGHLPMLRHLVLKEGVNINLEEARAERCPLFYAAWGMKAKIEIVQFLVENGAHVNAHVAYDGTVLHVVVMWEHPHILRYLLEHGANPRLTDAHGQSPLAYAKSKLRRSKKPSKKLLEIVEILEAASPTSD